MATSDAQVARTVWPAIDYAQWAPTCTTLHLWTQVIGKVRLALTPWLNHSWHVPLYVSARGLTTSPMPVGGAVLEIEFDFIDHQLAFRHSDGGAIAWPLAPNSVASFHRRVGETLRDLGVVVAIEALPCEIAGATPFDRDETHADYDAAAVQRFWRALIQANRVLSLFRTGFVGKASPVHFFWGSFDLAATRFSGRRAPPHPGGVPGMADAITVEAYSHEECSAGFWPGNAAFPHAAFYAYAYPEPAGYRAATMPQAAWFEAGLGEYILPYEAVRQALDPDALLLNFLERSYAAAANGAGWDRAALECPQGAPGRVPVAP